MKVEEQVTLLKNKKIGVGVGTPARLMELIDNGEISIRPNPFPCSHTMLVKKNLACARIFY